MVLASGNQSDFDSIAMSEEDRMQLRINRLR
jgi:phosphopantetheine adenylyltransferase